jgi:uncharacterized membrane-anchored protein
MNRDPEIEQYLAQVRGHLGSATASEEEEVIREVAARIEGLAANTGATAESVLGPADTVARRIRDAQLITRASRSNSPLLLLHASLKNGIVGVLAFLVGLAGYWLGGSIVVFGTLSLLWSAVHYKPNASTAIGSGILQTLMTVVAGAVVLALTTFLLRTLLRGSKRARL